MRLSPPLVPVSDRPGALAWLVGACCVVALLAMAAVSGLAGMLHEAADGRQMLVQVVDRDRRDATASTVMALLHASAAVADVKRMGETDARRLTATGSTGLPSPPVLIAITLTDPEAGRQLARRLRAIPSTIVTTERKPPDRLRRLVSALYRLGVGVAAAAAVAAALAALMAVRRGDGGDDRTAAILHGLGATDDQAARAVAQPMVRDAAIGAAVGTLVALAALMTLREPMADAGLVLATGDRVGLALVPPAIVLLVAGTAYLSALAALRRTP